MSWTCDRCATVNAKEVSLCDVCNGPRSTATEAPDRGTLTRSSSGGTVDGGFPAPSVVPPSARSTGAPQTAAAIRSAAPTRRAVASPDADTTGRSAMVVPVPPPARPRSVPVGLVLGIVAVGLLVGVGSYFVFSGGSGSGDGSTRSDPGGSTGEASSRSNRETDAGSPVSRDTNEGEADDPVVTVTTPTTTTVVAAERPATLFAGEAVLRASPSLTGAEVARYTGREGMGLVVLDEVSAGGWYKVRAEGGSEGYLFGAFVLPPSPGFCVGETQSRQAPTVYVDGSQSGAEKSGSKVLSTSQSEHSWTVLLPGGQQGEVHEPVRLVECGPRRR